jgi:hypothetical protein
MSNEPFDCIQSEGDKKCKEQCDHCLIYYRLIKEEGKPEIRKERLQEVLAICFMALKTYGSHPIIESMVLPLLNSEQTGANVGLLAPVPIEKRIHPVAYCNFWTIQSGPYYGDKDILNAEDVGEEEAEKNANLIANLLNEYYSINPQDLNQTTT